MSHADPRVPAPPVVPPVSRCPDDLTLARFADGTLDPAERPMVIAHLATCDDCRDVIATVEAARSTAAPTDTAGRRDVVAVAGRWRSSRVWIPALALAASLLVVLQVRRSAAPATDTPPGDPWTEVARVVGAERHLEARLSGLTAHVPLAAPTRSGPGDTASFATESLARRFESDAAGRPEMTHLAGVAALLAGRPADAVRWLRVAAEDRAAPASVRAARLADLAAAHGALAVTEPREEWQHALDAADAALDLDASQTAARFNRALALERLGRTGEARQAWTVVATSAAESPGWRDEAAAHLRALTP